MKKKYLLTGLMLLISIISFAQSNGSIQGTVNDEDGQPIDFANILIKGTEVFY